MIKATLCFVYRENPHPGILLGYKKRGFGMGKFDGFGGKLHDGETIAQAAARELLEESGITVASRDLIPFGVLTFIFPNKPVWDQEVHLFKAQNWHGVPAESEEMRPEWFDPGNLPFHKMWDDSHIWMPYFMQGHPIRAQFILNPDNETVKEYSIQLL